MSKFFDDVFSLLGAYRSGDITYCEMLSACYRLGLATGEGLEQACKESVKIGVCPS